MEACSFDTYDLEYKFFLAEDELFSSMINLGSIISESGEALYTIHESVKDIILKYLGKIVAGIEAAWEKLKNIFTTGPDSNYMKRIKEKVNKLNTDPGFEITNFKKFSQDKFDSIGIETFNYDNMKSSLHSVPLFLQTFYSGKLQGIGAPNADVKQIIFDYCCEIQSSYKITAADVKEIIYPWCADKYKVSMESLKKNIEPLNASSTNIQNLLNTITPAETQAEAVHLYESYLLEAENDNDTKMEFKDDPNKNPDGTSVADDKNNKLTQEVQVYMSASVKILTAKINVLKDIRKDYMRILKHIFPIIKKETNTQNDSNQETTNNDKYTIDVK